MKGSTLASKLRVDVRESKTGIPVVMQTILMSSKNLEKLNPLIELMIANDYATQSTVTVYLNFSQDIHDILLQVLKIRLRSH